MKERERGRERGEGRSESEWQEGPIKGGRMRRKGEIWIISHQTTSVQQQMMMVMVMVPTWEIRNTPTPCREQLTGGRRTARAEPPRLVPGRPSLFLFSFFLFFLPLTTFRLACAVIAVD